MKKKWKKREKKNEMKYKFSLNKRIEKWCFKEILISQAGYMIPKNGILIKIMTKLFSILSISLTAILHWVHAKGLGIV